MMRKPAPLALLRRSRARLARQKRGMDGHSFGRCALGRKPNQHGPPNGANLPPPRALEPEKGSHGVPTTVWPRADFRALHRGSCSSSPFWWGWTKASAS
jgi:hypothetical protein